MRFLSAGSRLLAGLLATVVLLTGAACGSSEDKPAARTTGESFTQAYQRITAGLVQRSRDIKQRTAEVQGADVNQLLSVYEQIQDSSKQAHDELRTLAAPSEVKQPLARLVTLLAQQNDLLGQLIQAAESEDREALSRSLTELVTLMREFDTARAALERAIATCGAECA